MEREPNADVIDLGIATDETKGQVGPIADFKLGQVATGLSDD
jgi:hypothetical protein